MIPPLEGVNKRKKLCLWEANESTSPPCPKWQSIEVKNLSAGQTKPSYSVDVHKKPPKYSFMVVILKRIKDIQNVYLEVNINKVKASVECHLNCFRRFFYYELFYKTHIDRQSNEIGHIGRGYKAFSGRLIGINILVFSFFRFLACTVFFISLKHCYW